MKDLISLLNKNNISYTQTSSTLIISPTTSPQFEYLYYNFNNTWLDHNDDIIIHFDDIPKDLPNPHYLDTFIFYIDTNH